MRLLERTSDGGYSLTEYVGKDIPQYAILSHTWGADYEEVTYKDLTEGTFKKKAGYRKIQFCSSQATRDGLRYFWIDTCCIDKSSSSELSEAINSMFSWYRRANKCYVYLSDVSSCIDGENGQSWKPAFRKSRWFTRGWTCQELVAPTSVEFFSIDGERLGDKISMVQELQNITNISMEALKGIPLQNISVKERISWIKHRNTKREEDMAYSMLGIFGIYMPLIYGEGQPHAFERLNNAITKMSNPGGVKPLSMVPFAPDADYVDRPEILAWVHEKCKQPGSRAALVGLGGVGSKSQLAIQYAHSICDTAPQTSIFWVHASTRARFEEAYRSIAERLDLPGRQDPEADVMQLVYNWLCEKSHGSWAMVLDNVDDVETFSSLSGNGRRLASYLPQSRHGSILVTSRSKDAAFELTGAHNRIKEVPAMDEGQALQLLRNKLGDLSDDESATELLKELNCIPLVINQTAAYINRRAHMTVAGYLAEFRTSRKKKESLLNWEVSDLRRDESASNSVVMTWQLSFERIRQERPSAADLLALMTSFNPQGIPERVLTRYRVEKARTKIRDKPAEEDDIVNEVGEDLDLLRAYSLVTPMAAPGMYEIHPLVQFCTRLWLASSGVESWWELEFLELMAKEFPFARYDSWVHCQQLLPHVEPLFEREPTAEPALKNWAQILTYTTSYMWKRGHFRIGENLINKAVAVRERLLGQEHEATLESLDILATILQGLGNFKDAEELLQRLVAIRVRNLGQDHLVTLTSLSRLAVVFHEQGKYSEAEKLHRRILEVREKLLGPDDEATLTSMSCLGLTLQAQGNYSEAEKLSRRVLEGSEKDENMPQIEKLKAVSILATALQVQQKYNEAEMLYRQVLEERRKLLGEQHPDTLTSMNNLALSLSKQGKEADAEALLWQVLKGREKEFDENHPSTLASVSNLARILHVQEKYVEAEELSRRALSGLEKRLGYEHPDTLVSVNNLANLLGELGRWDEAAALYERACLGLERQFGSQHPWTISCRSDSVALQHAKQAHSRESAGGLLKKRLHLRIFGKGKKL